MFIQEDVYQCEKLNSENSIRRIEQSELIKDLINQEKVRIVAVRTTWNPVSLNFLDIGLEQSDLDKW